MHVVAVTLNCILTIFVHMLKLSLIVSRIA